MNNCLIIIIGTDAHDYPGSHPFDDGYRIRHFPTANKIHTAIEMLEECDLDSDVIIFHSSSIVDSRITQLMDSIDPKAQVAFLADCPESFIAPRFIDKTPWFSQIRVYSPCCTSGIFIRSDYLKKLKQCSDSSSMLALLNNNLESGRTYGIRIFPPLIHCSPAKPHKRSTVNWEEIGQNSCWNTNRYLLLMVIAVVVILIVICVILLVKNGVRNEYSNHCQYNCRHPRRLYDAY
jgi:hypothetical protein